ncbi:hypothetical protein O181_126208 [Austropuccinia psidii MF-1]|uniref:Uncharacterized protein n=1 Tax=Austropuccinia psidii MF-1 TaxID=1389203 RepID=A0A9Q3KS17_9BASI|nr:hypothetical protein [Austropuccinia psidii MF-1]
MGILDLNQDSVAGDTTRISGGIKAGNGAFESENILKNGENADMQSEPRLGSIGKFGTDVAAEEKLSLEFVLMIVGLFGSSSVLGRGFRGVRLGKML